MPDTADRIEVIDACGFSRKNDESDCMEEEDRISGFEEFSNERVEQQVNFEIKRADMYHHADLGALERITLEDVLTLAEQYGLGDAVERIQRRLDEIE